MPHAIVSERQRGRAKQLRRTMTRAETLLWRYLKANRIDGLDFRRQVPFQGYVVDFVCFAGKLVIELDGESHDFVERQNADRKRDAFFAEQGFQVLRFTNKQVTSNLEGVIQAIRQTLSCRVEGPPPSPSLPHKGGGSREAGASVQDILADTITNNTRGQR